MKKIFLFAIAMISLLSSCIFEKPTEISLFYYKESLDPDTVCVEEAFLPVKREIKSKNLIFDTISLLIEGDLSHDEKAQGFSTEFPHPDFKLLEANLDENGTLTLDFTVVPGFTSGGSMRMKILSSQIEKTALHLPEVKKVKYKNEELFQP
ncbi:MAG: GerMN domain-containing protein [Candidatus Gracilibacteria bacterium]|jgi:spore germination protein GerM|nr:GerMN domain-containing protein [Candidatus Gracilibacteria bacterium]